MATRQVLHSKIYRNDRPRNTPKRRMCYVRQRRLQRYYLPLLILLAFFVTSPCFADRVVPTSQVDALQYVKVYDEPSTSSVEIGELRPGEEAEILASLPHWYKVQLANGTIGFVSNAWTEKQQGLLASRLLFLALILLLVNILLAQRRYRLLEFLFFCRFPLLLIVVMFSFPFLALGTGVSSLLKNLFSLSVYHLGVVTWLVVIAAWVLSFATELVFFAAQRYHNLSFQRNKTVTGGTPRWLDLLARAKPLLYAIPAVPTIFAALMVSDGPIWEWKKLVAVLLGLALADMFRRIAKSQRSRFAELFVKVVSFPKKVVPKTIRGSSLVSSFEDAYKHLGHHPPYGLIVFTLGIYLLGVYFLDPEGSLHIVFGVPALAYLLLVMIILGWMLPAISFYCDKFRVSTLLLLVTVSGISYFVSDSDHYYRVEPMNALGENATKFLPRDVVKAWAATYPPEETPPMVVVAASGGGIKAAFWTAKVLTSLRADREIGESFTKAITLISSVSGGGVGAMYFVDAFTSGGPPAHQKLQEIRNASSASSLEATVWGIAYPDLWRGLGSFLIVNKVKDRAWAQEERWKSFLEHPSKKLSEWRTGIIKGWRPVQIFNATITETGERFLITPIDIPPAKTHERGEPWGAHSFRELYPNRDLSVATAARLSATFPYLLPIAKPSLSGEPENPGYHVADGGYYDNFGIVTVVDWLRDVLPYYDGKKVIVVEIRASSHTHPPPERGKGWLYAAAGPVVTLMRVRSSTQTARNDLEIKLLQEAWAGKVTIDSIVFDLGTTGPLSWQLSQEEIQEIEEAWECTAGRNVAELGSMCAENEAAVLKLKEIWPVF